LEDAQDHQKGDCWDHVAFDPEHRLVLGVEFGKRSATRILKLMRTVKAQLNDRVPRLITSDEYASYATVLKLVFEPLIRPVPSGQGRKRPRSPRPKPSGLNYATICKQRENGRIVSVQTQVVLGSKKSVARALKQSRVSSKVNTSFLERHNATDRHRNARKARRTYRFSKDWDIHQAVGYFSYYTYNFCWCVRSLRQPIRITPDRAGEKRRPQRQRYQPRTPAMAAQLTDHVWTLEEWLSRPIPSLSA
jgi:IS1 family transposase